MYIAAHMKQYTDTKSHSRRISGKSKCQLFPLIFQ